MHTFVWLLVGITAVLVAEVGADACADPAQKKPLYREFSSKIGDHFYTTSENEYTTASTSNGYFAEGVRAAVFTSQLPSTVPFLRLWNGAVNDHFYTTNTTEANTAATNGYIIENITPMFVYPSQMCGAVPLYRLFSGAKVDHFYTTSTAERDGMAGYNFEFIDGYVLPVTDSTSSAGPESTSAAAPTPTKSNGTTSPRHIRPAIAIFFSAFSSTLLAFAGILL
ncbi:hypothetical protein C8R43DRAFT_1141353 [Mycena crocata]|nr:hypothetical protein C8R43DRAFT_1141353 [Mycena crocata]